MADDRDPPTRRTPSHDEAPPPPPDIVRHIRLYPAQWIGVPILLLLPILALAGAFGETRATSSAAHDGVRYDIEYPTRLRAGQHSTVHVRATLVGGAAGDTIEVEFDRDWMDRFTRISVVPEPVAPWRILLAGLTPGEPAEARIELEGHRLWRGDGTIRVRRTGGTTHDVVIRTFVFP